MKKALSIFSGVCVAIALLALLQNDLAVAQTNSVSSVNVVGFHTIDLLGTGGGNTERTILSIPMHKVPVYRGVVTDNDTTTVTDTNATWIAGQYEMGVSGQEANGDSTFYLEISGNSANFEGRYFWITNNTADTLTIHGGLPADVLADDLIDATYKIVPANRPRDVFGELGESVLTGGADTTDPNGDKAQEWDPTIGGGVGGWSQTIYYKTSGGTDPSNWHHYYMGSDLADDYPLSRDGALFVAREGTGDTNITIMGEVSANAQTMVTAAGRAFWGGMNPVDLLVGDSTLSNVVAGGADTTDPNAFKLIYWDPDIGAGAGGWSQTLYYKTSGGTDPSNWNKWFLGSEEATNFAFEAGRGYFIWTPSDIVWKQPSALE